MRYLATSIVVLMFASRCEAITFAQLLASYDNLETVAGTGLIPDKAVSGWLPHMEGGLATDAELSRPHMTMSDADGNLYIADKDSHAVRMVKTDGTIHTIAGTNVPGFNGDGPGVEIDLYAPNGLYTFPDGTTYILDVGNSLIRKWSPDGNVVTVVEDPDTISIGRGLWVSPDESLIYYSSETEVRRWTESSGVTVYGSGFVGLGNLAVDPWDGELVVTDREGHGVYKVYEDGDRELIAGNESTNGGGPGFLATQTGLEEVRGIAFHPEGGYLLATHEGGQVWFVDDNNRIHLLIDGDDKRGTHGGDGLPLTSPGRKISEPRAVTFSTEGDIIVTENDAGFIRYVRANRAIGVPGDFNFNGLLDVEDIDLLSIEGRNNTHTKSFDLNADSLVNDDDRQIWVNELKFTYFGDADLDGEFNSRDLVLIFQAGEFEDGRTGNSTWVTGDWDGNGDFNSGDFVVAFQAGGYEAGQRESAVGVPEPGMFGTLLLFVSLLIGCRRSF